MNYYFLGIAGTAMAAVAALLKKRGATVWGTDRSIYPPMSDFLAELRIDVREGYDLAHLDEPFDLAVIGNALSRGNVEVEAILNRRLPFISLPELIRNEFIRHHHNIVITGTHGKTTTTSLMSWVLDVAGLKPTFLIGGIAQNFNSSVQLGDSRYFVIEGDEYDCAFFDKRPKFVHYFPQHLIINNIEFDHADIYPDLNTIKNEFRKLLRIVPENGLVVANGDNPAVREILSPVYSRLELFGSTPDCKWRYKVLKSGPAGTELEIFENGERQGPFHYVFGGDVQLQNVLAVVAVARDLNISWETIGTALARFEGVQRRFEHWGRWRGADVYDDFAHHPTAIKATLGAARLKFPGRRIIALFEPRTNTTVRSIFQTELAEALSAADIVLLPPVFRQDRLPENDRLSLAKLADDLERAGSVVKMLGGYDQIIASLELLIAADDVLLLMTNGSLGGEYQKLRALVRS